MSDDEIKLGNNIQEFEEIFGNVPIKDLDKIRKYIADNYVSLDLYNKEKEKREMAEENYKLLSLDLGKALKELGLYEDTIIADELVLEINKRYISKDKIRELKQKIDKEHDKAIIEFMRKKENFTADGDVAQTLNWVSGQLEELLEERN